MPMHVVSERVLACRQAVRRLLVFSTRRTRYSRRQHFHGRPLLSSGRPAFWRTATVLTVRPSRRRDGVLLQTHKRYVPRRGSAPAFRSRCLGVRVAALSPQGPPWAGPTPTRLGSGPCSVVTLGHPGHGPELGCIDGIVPREALPWRGHGLDTATRPPVPTRKRLIAHPVPVQGLPGISGASYCPAVLGGNPDTPYSGACGHRRASLFL